MSVFGVREWWSKEGTTAKEYDVGSLCVLEDGVVVVCSLDGLLQAYKPVRRESKPEDLLLETQLNPVLQIEAGYFSHLPQKTLAVLHPRSIEVYTFTKRSLRLVYAHALKRNAFNFTFGKFGNFSGQGMDSICIQSSDGALGIYMQEDYLCAVQLPGFLVPGPITYLPSNDSFLLCNANMELECYKYSALREAYTQYQQGQEALFQAEWKLNLGEYAQSIQICSRNPEVDFYVLGEHSLFGVKQNGALNLQKRLDYTPCAMSVYCEKSVLIGSFTSHLLIYKSNQLLWAARMNSPPVALKVVNLEAQGLILSLDEKGSLQVSYLGTTPMSYTLAQPSKPQDYSEMEKQYRGIMKALSEAPSKSEPSETLKMKFKVVSLERDTLEGYASDEYGTIVTKCLLGAKFEGALAKNLCLHVQTPSNIVCLESPVYFKEFQGIQKVKLGFVTKQDLPPSSLEIQINACYEVEGTPRNNTLTTRLPILQLGHSVKPISSAEYKITLKATKELPLLESIFSDLELFTPNALSLEYFNGAYATIIVGKSGEKFRVQSSDFEALSVFTEELCKRVGEDSLEYQEPIPFQTFFNLIDSHFNLRVDLRDSQEKLSKLCEQYAVIQKRLLVRFKDKNPAPLNNLDYLIEVTHSQVAQTAEEVSSYTQELKVAAQKLSGAVRLVLLLLKLRFDISPQDLDVLKHHLSSHIPQEEPGWEELTNAAMVQLLRTSLAKNSKEASASVGNLEFPNNTEKLKKHITIVTDRIAKGFKLIDK